MAINKKLIHFKTKENFQKELEAGNILDTSIVFISDTQEIWTHGQFYTNDYTELIQRVEALEQQLASSATVKILTQDEYDAIENKDSNTLYVVS